MSSPIASAFVELMPETTGFGSAVERQVGGETSSSGKRLGGVFGKAFGLGAGLLAAAGIGSFLKGSVDEAREAQKVGAATGAILKATGGAAKLSAGQIGDLASSLSAKTAVDDEQIQAGANLLLTFKNVKREGAGLNDVFGRATAAGVDLAAAGFGSIEGNAKQLGKALNDPTKGIAALAKSGVTFTEGQKTQIAGFVKSNDLLSAQKIILGEVEAQVGGTAAATATSGEKASVAFGNIKEQVGTALLPVIDGFFGLFLSQVPRITKIIDGIGPAFSRVQAFVSPLAAQLGGLFGGEGGGGFLAGLQQVVGAVQTNFVPVLQAAFGTFTTVILPAVQSLAGYLLSTFGPILGSIGSIVTTRVLPIFSSLATFFYTSVIPAVVSIAGVVASNLRPIFDQLASTMQTKVLPAVDSLLAAFQRNQPAIQRVALAVIGFVGGAIKLGTALTGKVLPVLIRFGGFIIANVVPAVISFAAGVVRGAQRLYAFGQAVADGVKKVVDFAGKVGNKIGEVVRFFQDLPGKIRGAFGDAGGILRSIGGNIVDGLTGGIRAAAGKVTDAVRAIIDKIPKFIRERMGIASPSKVTTILGGYIGEGLAQGLLSSEKKVTKAVGKVLEKAKDKISSTIDDFKSLSDAVGSNLVGNLFSGFDTAGAFLNNAAAVKGNLSGLLGAFKTLRGFGLSTGFLAQLYSDGGAPLILDLASNKDAATAAGSIFNDIQSLASGLGDQVAMADISGGATLADLYAAQQETNKLLAKVPDGVAKGVNGAATGGKKRGNKGGGKKGKGDK